jgi:hypothetical protein
MKPERVFSTKDDSYIRENYLNVTDKEMSRKLSVTIPVLQQYRLKHNLVKYRAYGSCKVEKQDNELFIVGKRNWII